ncbi:MAG: cation transporter [Rikenellaceae bacterium]
MKNIIKLTVASIILLIASLSVAEAKAKTEKEIVTKCFITTLNCHSCAEKIMKVLPYQKGIKDVVVKVEEKSVTVTYDTSKNSEEAIVESLNRLDIKVVETPASTCCEGCSI